MLINSKRSIISSGNVFEQISVTVKDVNKVMCSLICG